MPTRGVEGTGPAGTFAGALQPAPATRDAPRTTDFPLTVSVQTAALSPRAFTAICGALFDDAADDTVTAGCQVSSGGCGCGGQQCTGDREEGAAGAVHGTTIA